MEEDALTQSSVFAFDVEAMKLGLRGVTLTVASGDDGAVSGQARKSPQHCRYAPSSPATSPYVLAVGATMV